MEGIESEGWREGERDGGREEGSNGVRSAWRDEFSNG